MTISHGSYRLYSFEYSRVAPLIERLLARPDIIDRTGAWVPGEETDEETKTALLDLCMLHEARGWRELGVACGYFASDGPRLLADDFENSIFIPPHLIEWTKGSLSPSGAPIFQTVRHDFELFSSYIDMAFTEFDECQMEFLKKVLFDSSEQWIKSFYEVRKASNSVLTILRKREQMRSDSKWRGLMEEISSTLRPISWATDGSANSEVPVGLPSDWRRVERTAQAGRYSSRILQLDLAMEHMQKPLRLSFRQLWNHLNQAKTARRRRSGHLDPRRGNSPTVTNPVKWDKTLSTDSTTVEYDSSATGIDIESADADNGKET